MTETFNTPPSFPNLESDSLWSYKGRFGRLSFLAWSLVALIALVITAELFFPLLYGEALRHNIAIPEYKREISAVAISIFYFAFSYFSAVFGIKRLHDINLSAWWIILQQPFTFDQLLKRLGINIFHDVLNNLSEVSMLFFLFLMFAKGTNRLNRFGVQRITLFQEKIIGVVYGIFIICSFSNVVMEKVFNQNLFQ